jgi:50S ribosomal protein L16 3-hydroxylase
VTSYALPDEFWSSFHGNNWEKKGAVIPRPFSVPLASPAESFACLVAASDRFRAGDRSVQLEFCIEHAQVHADVGRLLPEASDWSAEGYAARVTPLVGGRRFGLVVEDVQAYDSTLWLRLRDFLGGLFAHTGLPGDGCKATVFLGNYDRTPFGLHRGDSANFMFVVDGMKRMRTWPDAYFQGKADLTYSTAYSQHNAESIVMDAQPGDIIFWPSDYWHIGESVDGRMSSAVSVALFMTPRPAADVVARASRLVQQHMGEAEVSRPPNDSAHHMERITRHAARAREALTAAASDAALEEALRVDMLDRLTAFGFARPPRPLPHRPLAADDILRANPDYPILWMASDDDDIVCSASGHSFKVSASPHVTGLIASLNTGEPHRVRDLVEQFSGVVEANGVLFETSPTSVQRLLERLVSFRAIA